MKDGQRLTELGLGRLQHPLRLLPYGLAVLLQLVEPLSFPGVGLDFQQVAPPEEELEVAVILQT